MHGFERNTLDSHIRGVAASVYDGRRAHDLRPERSDQAYDLFRASSGRNDVFNHYGAISGLHRESPSKCHLPGGSVAFGEEGRYS
jgi:hypothetical protein